MTNTVCSVYIHIPYCKKKCHYCDFYSTLSTNTSEDFKKLTADLSLEGKIYNAHYPNKLDSVYIGGGTPSLLSCEDIESIINCDFFPPRLEKTEITIEANPSSITKEKLRFYKKLGINRISLGVQSLQNTHLLTLGRIHNNNESFRALELCFGAGIKNVSVDLICGIPGQNTKDFEADVTKLVSLPVRHISCYLLTLKKNNALFSKLPRDAVQLEHLLAASDIIRSYGFNHYEISNYAKPGFESKHNLNYWTLKSYLGLGPSAHSYFVWEKRRFKNYSSVKKYHDLISRHQSPTEWSETLNPTQENLEKWMLTLRLSSGFPRAWLVSNKQKENAEKFITAGLIEPHPQTTLNLKLTARGMFVSDSIISALYECAR